MRHAVGPQPLVRRTEIQFSIDNRKILLMDDVLYTGRTTRAALDAFTSFMPDADVAAHCESLKKRAAGISANAKKLSTEAMGLAEGMTLPGECKYTKLE